MEEKYKLVRNEKTCIVCKNGILNVKELKEMLDELIRQEKEDYAIYHEGFCCEVQELEISDLDKQISLD